VSNGTLFDCVLDMALATYLNDQPTKQVKRIAKKHLKSARGKSATASYALEKIIFSSNPVGVVRLAHNELEKDKL
jgi:hypothetical protein